MLAERIIDTLRFFDLQNFPLTGQEVHKYLIAETVALKTKLDHRYELLAVTAALPPVQLDTVLGQLDGLKADQKIFENNGFYCLPGRQNIIHDRLRNYLNGIKRERLVRRYLLPTRHIPFVRGIALAGSQALGQQRRESDIDLLIITDPKYMWTARTLLSLWFHIFGVRRHGKKIANRFCLNHYLAYPREVDAERNLYKAMEYTKLRPMVYESSIRQFQKANAAWIRQFFPNAQFDHSLRESQSSLQKILEKVFSNRLGLWLERLLGNWQRRRIRQDQFVFIREDELSFHPDSKHQGLLQGFFT